MQRTHDFFRDHKFLVYAINNTPIKKLESQKDLGIIIDRKLTFSDHITSITKQFMRLLGLLYRLKDVRNLSSFVTFYKALLPDLVDGQSNSPLKIEFCT